MDIKNDWLAHCLVITIWFTLYLLDPSEFPFFSRTHLCCSSTIPKLSKLYKNSITRTFRLFLKFKNFRFFWLFWLFRLWFWFLPVLPISILYDYFPCSYYLASFNICYLVGPLNPMRVVGFRAAARSFGQVYSRSGSPLEVECPLSTYLRVKNGFSGRFTAGIGLTN